jgi:hypothetical protein
MHIQEMIIERYRHGIDAHTRDDNREIDEMQLLWYLFPRWWSADRTEPPPAPADTTRAWLHFRPQQRVNDFAELQ